MRVNFHFTSILTNRLMVGSGIAIILFAVFFTTSSYRDPSDRSLLVKEVNIIIRQIGHKLLLQSGDSSSRVMPVTETREGTFQLRFENKFNFNHDSLQQLSLSLLPKTKFPSGYTVTVQDCRKGDIVYGFQINNSTPDILPCAGRTQPQGCYTIEFVFPDLYENIEPKKSAINQKANASKPVKSDLLGVNSDPDILKPVTVNNNPDQETKEIKSVKADSGKSTPPFNNALSNVFYVGVLLLLVATALIWNYRRTLKPAPVQSENNTIINESAPELASLGKFLFNVKAQRLLLGDEVISLTVKECKVLELLHRNFGELIPRETLMQEVWINEGVITGRSLDMFVSKLRKKLNPDPELRITNVHGKGYKLEIALV